MVISTLAGITLRAIGGGVAVDYVIHIMVWLTSSFCLNAKKDFPWLFLLIDLDSLNGILRLGFFYGLDSLCQLLEISAHCTIFAFSLYSQCVDGLLTVGTFCYIIIIITSCTITADWMSYGCKMTK